MVDTSLNRRYQASEARIGDFSPIPEGKYTVRVKEITEWKESKKDVKVIIRDEDGKPLLDEKGERVTELQKDCVFYNANVKFEIVGGEYEGRMLFHNLTTHPNMDFSISNFLYAIGKSELSAAEIPTECLKAVCEATVIVTTYEKKTVDKDTGLETVEQKPKNEIKYLSKLPEIDTNNEDDLGI